MIYYIDLVNYCNLRCKNCPRGELYPEIPVPEIWMTEEKLVDILEKAVHESPIHEVGLFNWTEPFLHNNVDKFVRIVKQYGLICCLSSNLSLNKQHLFQKVIEAGLDTLIVSISGFTQDVHGQNHVKSNIEVVKKNLVWLSNLVKIHSLGTDIVVHYLDFGYNKHQIGQMEEFCINHGLHFFVKTGYPLSDPSLEERLLDGASPYFKNNPCWLIYNTMALDCEGNIFLCCAQYNLPKYKIGNYQDIPFQKIQKLRKLHMRCIACRGMRDGTHAGE